MSKIGARKAREKRAEIKAARRLIDTLIPADACHEVREKLAISYGAPAEIVGTLPSTEASARESRGLLIAALAFLGLFVLVAVGFPGC